MRKLLIPVLFVVLAVAGTSLVSAQSPKIGVFDPQRISEETEEGKRVEAALVEFRNNKQAELSAKEQAIADLQNQLNTQGLSLSAERRSALEKDIQKKMLELNSARESAQREMQLEIGSAQQRFQEQLFAVVEQFGSDEGFTVIMDVNLVAWASPTIDVTTALVDRFNTVVSPAPESE